MGSDEERIREREDWERQHHRFGLAGDGQADVIELILKSRQGRVLYVGCGFPDYDKFENLARHGHHVIAIDNELKVLRQVREAKRGLENVEFIRADARNFGRFEREWRESFDHILALGLFFHINRRDQVVTVFSNFWRVCRSGGYLMVTNSSVHPKEIYIEDALDCGFNLQLDREDYCSSTRTHRRYLLVFKKPNDPPTNTV